MYDGEQWVNWNQDDDDDECYMDLNVHLVF